VQQRGVDFPKVSSGKYSSRSSTQMPTASASARVDAGGGQTLQIVCGAKNYRVGDKVRWPCRARCSREILRSR